MANKTIKAAIKGSIANPAAAEAVLDSIDSVADVTQLESDLSDLQDDLETAEDDITAIEADIAALGELSALDAAAAIADIATADASDPASVITLANANKAKINALLASLRAAGILDT